MVVTVAGNGEWEKEGLCVCESMYVMIVGMCMSIKKEAATKRKEKGDKGKEEEEEEEALCV